MHNVFDEIIPDFHVSHPLFSINKWRFVDSSLNYIQYKYFDYAVR